MKKKRRHNIEIRNTIWEITIHLLWDIAKQTCII